MLVLCPGCAAPAPALWLEEDGAPGYGRERLAPEPREYILGVVILEQWLGSLTIAIAVGKIARSGKLRLLYKFMIGINEFRCFIPFMTGVNE